MARPTTVRVDDDEVSIQWDVKMGRMPQGYPWGADYRANTVRIASHTRRSAQREHLMHELLHKLWDKSGLSDNYAGKTEEFIIASIGGWLVDMLRDNPDLVEFLTEEDE